MPHLIVVRHGERIDEVDRQEWRRIRTQETQHDPPLTAAGWEQAKAAGKKVDALLPYDGVTVYSSPTSRTLSTASAIVSNINGKATSVVPVYALNCCAAAQDSGVAKAFPKGEPDIESVMQGVPLSCWPPLGDADQVDRCQSHAGGFVELVKSLASTHSENDVLVLVTHREGIWEMCHKVGGKMKSGYCNISLYSYDAASQELKSWDGSSSKGTTQAHAANAPPRATLTAANICESVAGTAETLEEVLARGEGTVIIHRRGRGGVSSSGSTLLWCTPGVRGKWTDGGAVPDGEVVTLRSPPVSSEGKEGDFVLVKRSSGIEGWTKVCNVHLHA